jgi:hypothetical protein
MCSMNDHPPYEDTVPTCDGTTERFRAGGFGIEEVPCSQRVALVSFSDFAGLTRYACVRHVTDVQRRYGRMEQSPEWLHETVR